MKRNRVFSFPAARNLNEIHNNMNDIRRELNRNKIKECQRLSRHANYNSTRGLEYEVSDPETAGLIESTATSRELRLKKWKAEKELMKKEKDLKKPPFVVRSASKIPSVVSVKANRHNTCSFIQKSLLSNKSEKNIPNAQRLVPPKAIPKITLTSTKPALPPEKREQRILVAPTSRKTVPKSNFPSIKISSTSTAKPSNQPKKDKVNFSNIPKTTFCKTVPKLFLFASKNTEKTAIKSKFDKNKAKATDPVSQASSFLPCNVSSIEIKVDVQITHNFENTLCVKDASLTPNPKMKIRTSTPLKGTHMSVLNPPKDKELDTLALLEDFSSTVQHSCTSDFSTTVESFSDEKILGTCSKENKNTLLEDKAQMSSDLSLTEKFSKLEVEEIDLKNCEKTQKDKITKDFESQIQTPSSLPSMKNPEMDTMTTPRRSERLKEKNKIYSQGNLQSMERPSEIRFVDTESSKKNKQIDSPNTCSVRLMKKFEKKDSCEDLKNMPRPSVMGLVDTDDSMDSTSAAAAANISYDFDSLDNEDQKLQKLNEKNLKKVSLLYDPKRRQTRFSCIKGDLMTFSPPE